METQNLTVMFTDMKGFTSKTSVHTREQLEKLLDLQDELIRPIFEKYKGRIVKTIGDAFMVIFNSPTDAVLCGIKIQEELLKHNETHPDEEDMEIRVGINSGEVNVKGEDYFGEAVNIASRIESIAEPNEVYFTESVYLSMNKNEIPSLEVGIRRLKGIPDEIKVFKVLREEDQVERIKSERKRMAEASNSISKSSGSSGARKKEGKDGDSVKIVRMILLFAGGIAGFLILMVIIMMIFKICPPVGPWPNPPWCSNGRGVGPIDKEETKEAPSATNEEKIIRDVKKAIANNDIARAKQGLDELVRILVKSGGNPELEKTINNLKDTFADKFQKGSVSQ